MAGTVPCQVCEAIGENVLSQFLVKPLEDVGGMPEGVTVWLCQNHLVTVVLGWFDQPEATTMDPPDDVAEGSAEVEPARANGRGSKRKTQPEESTAAEEVPEATAAADVAE